MIFTRTRWIVIALAIGAIAAGAFILDRMMSLPDGLDLSRSKASEGKTYVVAVAPEHEPLHQGEMHAWVLTLKTPDGAPVESARIGVDGDMPQHGHGLPTSPQMTTYLGAGRYRIEGVKFNMGGWWELKFAISAPPGDDRAVFNLVL
jgi:hypothetical protein